MSLHEPHRTSPAVAVAAAVVVLGRIRHSVVDLTPGTSDARLGRMAEAGYESYWLQPGGDVIVHCEEAVSRLLNRGFCDPRDIGSVIVASDTMLNAGRQGLRMGMAQLLKRTGLEGAYVIPTFLGECGNFWAATALAEGLIKAGHSKKVLVVASETRGVPTVSWNSGALLSDSALAAIIEPDEGRGLRIEGLMLANDPDLAIARAEPGGSFASSISALKFCRRVADAWRERVRQQVERDALLVHANLLEAFNFMFQRELGIPYVNNPDLDTKREIAHAGVADIFMNIGKGHRAGLLSGGSRLVTFTPGNHVWNIAICTAGDLSCLLLDERVLEHRLDESDN